uniref:Autophagy-related protein 9 n=1 Tax=Clastoptera arizonana TaxID=38151 RepID=A0A1B6D492_9HEMI
MMRTMETSYQQFGVDGDESEETPQEIGAMIHIVPESGKSARWNHIEDLDSFFARNYLYHQKHGFACMILQEILELVQFIFVVFFSTFLFNCINYPVLFRDNENNSTVNNRKIALSDAVLSTGQCIENIPLHWWCVIFVSIIFWLFRAVRVVYHIFQYWNIKAFFNTALKIQDSELDNVTWHEVQRRIREVQLEQQMCIHKRDLSELDIYHRILRFKNYMVAMVNKSLLPVKIKVPVLGHIVYFSNGLKYNINFLLFWGPWSPFQNNWHLKEDFKKANKRHELSLQMKKHILYVALINLFLCPLIMLWQILYSFFNYAEILKREPGNLGLRCWSQYGRLYLRHFNELDHELNARLNRAYRPASKYMSIFTSPIMTVIAQNVVFVAGSILAVLLALTVYDEDVLTVDHVLSAITLLGGLVAGFRVFIPDENLVWCPENLMTAVLAHVHYLPDNWKNKAHTSDVRKEFAQLFQYKATYLLTELLSPLITPLALYFCIRPRTLDIIDFFRNFTVEVIGVGDVCSFAQMDVRRHGNPTWHTPMLPLQPTNQINQAEDGKTELSLIHFTLTNPEWKPPVEAENFVSALKAYARQETINMNTETVNAIISPETVGYIGDNSLSSLGIGLSNLLPHSTTIPQFLRTTATSPLSPGNIHHMRSNRAEGPLQSDRSHLFSSHFGASMPSVGGTIPFQTQENSNTVPEEIAECTTADMSLSTLFLHELHHRQLQHHSEGRDSLSQRQHQTPIMISPPRVQERTPLLHGTPNRFRQS